MQPGGQNGCGGGGAGIHGCGSGGGQNTGGGGGGQNTGGGGGGQNTGGGGGGQNTGAGGGGAGKHGWVACWAVKIAWGSGAGMQPGGQETGVGRAAVAHPGGQLTGAGATGTSVVTVLMSLTAFLAFLLPILNLYFTTKNLL